MLSNRNRQILQIAIPSIVSNITVPLLGLVDMAIVGHLGAAAYIAAISIGSMVFNTTYWIFGFLRMGSSGLTSQALGRHDLPEVARTLVLSLSAAFAIALALLVLQVPLCRLALLLMQPSAEVERLVTTYYRICIWGAPAMLGLYSLNGWFIGMQNSRIPMAVAITQNVVNIAASLLLVFGMGMKVAGVATGTLIAQWIGFLLAGALCWKYYGKVVVWGNFEERGARSGEREMYKDSSSPLHNSNLAPRSSLHAPRYTLHTPRSSLHAPRYTPPALRSFFIINRDIFLRTLCLVAVMLFFTSAGSWQGEVVLAVNSLLMQLYLLVSYVMDGFANAAEAMSGKYYGAGNHAALRSTVRHCFGWGAVCTAAFTLAYVLGGDAFLRLLTDEPAVVEASRAYLWWAWLLPACSIGAFIWDGVFIGLTASRQMLISSAIAAALFFVLYYSLRAPLGNHGLWLAMNAYLLCRGIVQTLLFVPRFWRGSPTA